MRPPSIIQQIFPCASDVITDGYARKVQDYIVFEGKDIFVEQRQSRHGSSRRIKGEKNQAPWHGGLEESVFEGEKDSLIDNES